MVSRGELSQDSQGRVRIDELIGILKANSMSVKRGPKIRIDISNYNTKIYKFNGKSLEVENLELDDLTVLNETVNHEIIKNIIIPISFLSSATLEEIAKQAMCICHHKRRLAKVGFSFDASKVLKTLYST